MDVNKIRILRGNESEVINLAYVYRYIDLLDGIIKYIGIVWSEDRTLQQRIYEHLTKDIWCKGKNWKIEYFVVNNRTEAENFESHFIALYETYKYYNDAKSDWGVSSYLPKEINWIEYKQLNLTNDELETVDLYEVSFNKKTKEFSINKLSSIKATCKTKRSSNELYCKHCGNNNLIMRSNNNGGQILKCCRCNISVGTTTNYNKAFYNPTYNGEYVYENGEIKTFFRYVFQGKYRKEIKDTELYKCCQYRDGTCYIYGFEESKCKEFLAKMIASDIKNTEKKILDLKKALNDMKSNLKEEKLSLDIVLNAI